jgi:hypothetical protein
MRNRTGRLFGVSAFALGAMACSGASGKLPLAQGDPAVVDASSGASDSASSTLASATGDATTDAATTPPSDATTMTDEAATTANPCAGLAVCDDFESTALGQPPRPSLWSIGAPDCSPQRGTAVIDSTQAHSGKHSVKVVNDFGANATPPAYCDHVFFNNTTAFAGAMGQDVYARFYVYLGEPLDPASDMHVTFATMTDNANGGDQLRIGVASNVFVWNRKSDNAYLPELDTGNQAINTQAPATLQPATNAWFCVEFHIDQAAGTIDTWIDGTEYPGLADTGTPVTDVSTVWLSGGHATWMPQISSFGLGWETYVNRASDAMVLWFDDVAIANRRIGCLGADGGP